MGVTAIINQESTTEWKIQNVNHTGIKMSHWNAGHQAEAALKQHNNMQESLSTLTKSQKRKFVSQQDLVHAGPQSNLYKVWASLLQHCVR